MSRTGTKALLFTAWWCGTCGTAYGFTRASGDGSTIAIPLIYLTFMLLGGMAVWFWYVDQEFPDD